MKIKFIEPENNKRIKATIHKTGKLGFSSDAIEHMKLNENKSISIGVNEENRNDTNLYLVVNNGLEDNAFRLNKAGAYLYLNTKAFFDKQGVDYRDKDKSIIYDITEMEYEGKMIYKLILREKKRRIKK